MDISIIIVNWNTKDLLAACLRSIQNQSLDYTYEIIVVDNGSEDGSQLIVRQEFPTVTLVENKLNLGFGKANNIGLQSAKGRYICFVNSDIEMVDGCLQILTQYMDDNHSVGMSGPQILYPDLNIQDSCRKFPSLWRSFCSASKLDRIFPTCALLSGEHMFYLSHTEEIKPDYLAGCLLMARKTALDEVGAFDERFFIYAEEVDLAKRLWDSRWEVAFMPQAKAVHHHAGSSSRDPLRFLLAQQKSVFQYLLKHHNLVVVMSHVTILFTKYFSHIIVASLLYLFSTRQRVLLERKIHCTVVLIQALWMHLLKNLSWRKTWRD